MLLDEIKLVIFDMDGLLVDFKRIYSEGWAAGIEHYDANLPDNIIYRMSGRSPKDNTELLNSYSQDEVLVQNIRDIRRQYFIVQLHSGNVHLKSFAKDLLQRLKSNGYNTALATTTAFHTALQILYHHNMLSLFDYAVFGDQVNEVKPAPDLYLNIISHASVPEKKPIIPEDSLRGATAGKNAGIQVILIPDPLYTNLDDINDSNIIAIHDHLGGTFYYFF